MSTKDYDELDRLLAQLCAGFDRPYTAERREAYRRGLSKMHPAMLERVVDHCLGGNGPERFPTTQQLWQISRELRRKQRQHDAVVDETRGMSRWEVAANRILFQLAYCDIRRGFRPIATFPPMPPEGYGLPLRLVQPTDRSLLDKCLELKREIVGYAEEAERAGDPWTNEEFVDVCQSTFEKLITPSRPAANASPSGDARALGDVMPTAEAREQRT